MADNDYQRVARVEQVPDGGTRLVEVGDRLVVLVRVGEKIFALDDVCTHDGGPLSDGMVDAAGCTIACPRHGAKFDLKTGAARTMPATEATAAHEVRIEGEDVLVRLSAD